MAELAPVHEQILRAQSMHGDEPGTVLRDVETLLAFIGDNTPTVSAKNHLLPMGSLAPLNAQMTHPMQLGLKRPQQRAYAHIHALYLLLRASGLASITGTGNTPRLALDEDGLASWRHLNSTERYFTLVEIWLLRGRRSSANASALFAHRLPTGMAFFGAFPTTAYASQGTKGKKSAWCMFPAI